MSKMKVIGGAILGIVILVFLGLYVIDFINDEDPLSDILIWVVIIMMFFQFATWGNDSKASKDEMGKQIKNKSGRISYYFLTLILFIFWLIDNFVNQSLGNLSNILLLTAICLAIIIYPIVQYIVARGITK